MSLAPDILHLNEESRKALQALWTSREKELARLLENDAKRATDGVTDSRKPGQTNGERFPAPYAAAPASSKTRLPVRSREKPSDLELAFRDESRTWNVALVSRCSICRYEGALQDVYRPMPGRRVYRMKCTNPRCANATDWFPNSQDAIRVWRFAAALVK